MAGGIRLAQSCARDARQAAREFHAAVAQPDMALVVFFCSSRYDLAELAAELGRLFAGVLLVGCTTAGEIGPLGYRDHSLAGASFPAAQAVAAAARCGDLTTLTLGAGHDFARGLVHALQARAPWANSDNSFGLLLIDGLCGREEVVSHALQGALGRRPLVGGSAGDGSDFGRTWVYFDGAFHSEAAVLVLLATSLPFTVFKTQHFLPTEETLIVTHADAARRLVYEFNGLPAVEEYARAIGAEPKMLAAAHFAAHPIMVVMDGSSYVRSIREANADGSLSFYCAIEEGLVLRLARGIGMIENLEQAFAGVRAEVGAPQLVLGCDCILRRLEMTNSGLTARAEDIFRQHRTLGFGTYGEQFRGMHVNQTLTGIAIGAQTDDRNA